MFVISGLGLVVFLGGVMRDLLSSARRGWALAGFVGGIAILSLFSFLVAAETALTVIAGHAHPSPGAVEAIFKHSGGVPRNIINICSLCFDLAPRRDKRQIDAEIVERYELGALGTGAHHFYERLGWQVWQGSLSVRTDEGDQRTPDEEGDILVLETPARPGLDVSAPLSCEWRPGDVW